MNVPTRLSAFAAVLAIAFGGAALAGATIDPTEDPVRTDVSHGASDPPAHDDVPGRGATATDAAVAGAPGAGRAGAPSGLAVSQGGYTLRVDQPVLRAGASRALRFRITGPDGRAVRDGFEVQHEKRLHLVVVRRDTRAFQHVHPELGTDGVWRAEVRADVPGVHRMYADFRIGGVSRTLATDLFVPGDFDPREFPAPTPTGVAVDEDGSTTDAITVGLETPHLRAGRETTLTFTATNDGRPVEDLQPHLGAKGHLVALREGDLAYLHAHPVDERHRDATGADSHAHGSAGDEVRAERTRFATTFPTPGRYRLFLQFSVDGRVRTVDHTVEVPR